MVDHIFKNLKHICVKICPKVLNYPYDLGDWSLSTYCDRWKINLWYGLSCCVKSGQNWIILPVFISLNSRLIHMSNLKTFYAKKLKVRLLYLSRPKDSQGSSNDEYDSPNYSWSYEVFATLKNVVHPMHRARLCVLNCCLFQQLLKKLTWSLDLIHTMKNMLFW